MTEEHYIIVIIIFSLNGVINNTSITHLLGNLPVGSQNGVEDTGAVQSDVAEGSRPA